MREDLYDGAVDGGSLAIATVTHEVAHYIYFLIFGVPRDVAFEEINGRKVSRFYEMELKADALMELLFCPEKVNSGRSESEVLEAYVVRPLVNLLVTIIKKCVFDSMMKIAVERLPQKRRREKRRLHEKHSLQSKTLLKILAYFQEHKRHECVEQMILNSSAVVSFCQAQILCVGLVRYVRRAEIPEHIH